MWYQKIIQIFKLPDLRNKIIFVLFIFAIFRLMAKIPVPAVNSENLQKFFNQFQIFGLYSIFSGGALEKISIVMLGLGPYITATIILQLLTMIFPSLERLYKEEGEMGRQKFNQYARIATVPLAALQGWAMLSLFAKQGVISNLSGLNLIATISTVTAGSIFLMWLGELISEKGIGNGVSLLIFAGIVADIPTNIGQELSKNDPSLIPSYLLFLLMALIIITGVVFVTEARRNIPVSYAKRVRGMRVYGGVSTYLPLNVNPAGVIPIIFALSILLFPGMIATFLSGVGGGIGEFAKNAAHFFQDPLVHAIFYFLLVILFTYFYTMVTFDPKAISQNLQKMGGFVPGIRPGESTANFLKFILNRVLLIGAVFLGTVAISPSIVQGLTHIQSFRFLVGGTSLLIVVSVVLETMRQINAQLEMREYETF